MAPFLQLYLLSFTWFSLSVILADQGLDRRLILQWILEKQRVYLSTKPNCLRVRINGVLLWIR